MSPIDQKHKSGKITKHKYKRNKERKKKFPGVFFNKALRKNKSPQK